MGIFENAKEIFKLNIITLIQKTKCKREGPYKIKYYVISIKRRKRRRPHKEKLKI
jgi:hypothetical protein